MTIYKLEFTLKPNRKYYTTIISQNNTPDNLINDYDSWDNRVKSKNETMHEFILKIFSLTNPKLTSISKNRLKKLIKKSHIVEKKFTAEIYGIQHTSSSVDEILEFKE